MKSLLGLTMVVGTVLVVPLTAVAQTQQQTNTRNATAGASTDSGNAQVAAENLWGTATNKRDLALAKKQDCINAGATPQQLASGQTAFDIGDNHISNGSYFMDEAYEDASAGGEDYLDGENEWMIENFTEACVYYDAAKPQLESSTEDYNYANIHFAAANDKFTQAFDAWDLLLEML